MNIHNFLTRQLAKSDLSHDKTPDDIKVWQEFLKSINNYYFQVDNSRQMLERSLTLSSQEMQERWTALQESENYKRAIIESAIDGIIITDPSGLILDTNPATCAIFSANSKEIISRNIIDLLPQCTSYQDVSDNDKNRIFRLHDENTIARIEMTGVSISDFSEFPLEVTCKS